MTVNTGYRVVLVMALAACALTLIMPHEARAYYVYMDDFSTYKAEFDSYLHSELTHEMPEIWLSGFLLYGWMLGEPVLAFYGGFDPGFPAVLAYRFPLGDTPYLISACEIELVLFACSNPFYVAASSDGSSWDTVLSATLPGVYSVQIDHTERLDGWQYVRFVSEGACLSSFRVWLDCVTPVEPSSWSAIKAMYR